MLPKASLQKIKITIALLLLAGGVIYLCWLVFQRNAVRLPMEATLEEKVSFALKMSAHLKGDGHCFDCGCTNHKNTDGIAHTRGAIIEEIQTIVKEQFSEEFYSKVEAANLEKLRSRNSNPKQDYFVLYWTPEDHNKVQEKLKEIAEGINSGAFVGTKGLIVTAARRYWKDVPRVFFSLGNAYVRQFKYRNGRERIDTNLLLSAVFEDVTDDVCFSFGYWECHGKQKRRTIKINPNKTPYNTDVVLADLSIFPSRSAACYKDEADKNYVIVPILYLKTLPWADVINNQNEMTVLDAVQDK